MALNNQQFEELVQQLQNQSFEDEQEMSDWSTIFTTYER